MEGKETFIYVESTVLIREDILPRALPVKPPLLTQSLPPFHRHRVGSTPRVSQQVFDAIQSHKIWFLLGDEELGPDLGG